jgi:flagellar basal body-associated protein FliL
MFLLLVTLISLVLAVIMTVITWRVSQEERRRSDARVAALAADIHDDAPAVRHDGMLREADLRIRGKGEADAAAPFTGMFAAPAGARTEGRLVAVVFIGLLVFGSAAAVAVVFGRSASHGAGAGNSVSEPGASEAALQPVAPNPPTAMPLELIALGHERDGDRLTVRGIIHNPAAAAELDRLTAVVFVFNAEGGFSGSGRAAVESAALLPGAESTFVVTVTGVKDIARYRVSFRTDDRVVPHVDRRDHMPARN